MRRIYLSLCLLAALFFVANSSLTAQETGTNNDIIVIQKVTTEDGTVTVKKKKFEPGQSPDKYIESLEMDAGKHRKMELTLITDGDENADAEDAETIIFIRDGSNQEIIIKGQGDWEEGVNNFHFDNNFEFDFNSEYEYDYNHDHQVHVKVENRALLGVYPETSENGVLVESLVSGGGAEDAGMLSGDVMTAINGEAISTNDDLRRELAKYQPGDVVAVDFLRGDQSISTNVTLTERQKTLNHRDPCKVFIGVSLGSQGSVGREGIGVVGIISGWPAEEAGIQRGDRILTLNDVEVNTFNELLVERNKNQPGDYFTLTINREGEILQVDAQFRECPKDEPAEEILEEETPEPEAPIEINNRLELGEFTAYPNPTAGDLNVRFQGEAVPTTLTITDINGKLVYQEKIESFDGYYSKEIDVTNGTPGTLTVTVNQEAKIQSMPVILLNRA